MTCVFELTRSLVDIESISGNEMEAASFPSDLLSRLTKKYQGRAERMEVETRRCNVFASWGDARGTRIVVDPVPCSNVLKSGVNVRMISQGASRLNLGVGMAPEDLPEAVEALHREFFTNLDPAVFD
jgi:aspartate kinase